MVREDGKRNFALRDAQGRQESVFSGNTPRHAALKAARKLESCKSGSSEAEAKQNTCEIRLRDEKTNKVHVYAAWAWETEAPADRPSWMGDTITEANVTKKGIELE